jgi:hypothetical protein
MTCKITLGAEEADKLSNITGLFSPWGDYSAISLAEPSGFDRSGSFASLTPNVTVSHFGEEQEITIILHRRKLVFVHSEKTGGSSVSAALWSCSAAGDVGTPFLTESDKLVWGEDREMRALHNPNGLLLDHMECKDIRTYLGDAWWNNYTKATIVREPMDQSVSLFFWERHLAGERKVSRRKTRSAYLEWLHGSASHLTHNYQSHTKIDSTLCLDVYLNFHRLKKEVSSFWDSQGLCDEGRIWFSGQGLKSKVRPKWATPTFMLGGSQDLPQEVLSLCDEVYADFPFLLNEAPVLTRK